MLPEIEKAIGELTASEPEDYCFKLKGQPRTCLTDVRALELRYDGQVFAGRAGDVAYTNCSTAVAEVACRSIAIAAAERPGLPVAAMLPARILGGGPKVIRKESVQAWLIRATDIITPLKQYGDQRFPIGAADTFPVFGIGRSVEWRDVRAGDFVNFEHEFDGTLYGHAVIFLSHIAPSPSTGEWEEVDRYRPDCVGFKFFSSNKGTKGFGKALAVFRNKPSPPRPFQINGLRAYTISRVTEGRSIQKLSAGRLFAPEYWRTGSTSSFEPELLKTRLRLYLSDGRTVQGLQDDAVLGVPDPEPKPGALGAGAGLKASPADIRAATALSRGIPEDTGTVDIDNIAPIADV